MSFFKAPSWARSQTVKAEDKSERNIFSHSDTFLDLQKERIEREARRKQKEKDKEERRKAKQEEKRRSSSEKRKVMEEDGNDSLKKRRITAEDGAKLLVSAGLGDSITISDSEDDAQAHLPIRRSPRTIRMHNVLSPSKMKGRPAAPPNVDEEEDLYATSIPPRPVRPQAHSRPEVEEEVDSDPEIAEIQRKARAAARLKEKAKIAQSATPEQGTPGIDDSFENSHLPITPVYDAAVQLLIESSIPDTAPLIVFRKLSQPLREVKKSWCKKQNFSEEFSKQVCLVYNGRKYFDSSTVQRLGISADANGRVFLESDPTAEGVEKVHMLAMTEEMYEQFKEERERQARAETGDYEGGQDEAEAGDDEEVPAPRRSIKLIVKAKDRKDYKVQVFDDTTFQKLLRAAKKVFDLGPEQEAYLELDGERLDPEDEVGNTDLEDMDQVQMVLVR
ncbi:hypothetical protein DOTSEDRAFT_28385 [Dothistroma septosporum NZE10]|uniref:Rad60/SUMO-like domain-containing protein n=1 Tax=Dothistroma septosporum (strain NZE10 / CBS 128990) TaxID=675120 RepID=M2YJU5_DOTSN|nr:hypothetical protein DOTSEDRAFT_28385 [Dothistroma septosporum NZE10]